jgi:hypothetical protein
MNTQLEKLIEGVVKDLKSEHPDVLLPQNLLDMIDTISLLSSGEDEGAMKAVRYFISLIRLPEVFVAPKQGAR